MITLEVLAAADLRRARVRAEVCQDDQLRYLTVTSLVDVRQVFLFPLRGLATGAGLSVSSRMGRLHSRCWSLVYGSGALGETSAVRFRLDRLRWHAQVEVEPQALGPWCWVADAEGTFDRAEVLDGERPVAAIALADRW